MTAKMPNQSYTNSIGMKFALIPAGSFMMGDKKYNNERPLHEVTITQPFYLGQYPVTQAQWVKVMVDNHSKFKGQNNPVERVYWDDTQRFIRTLNANEGHGRYRLPTEAEWEYAVRAGTTGSYFFGDITDEDEFILERYGWFGGNSNGRTHAVGRKLPNPWGLYDVYGNVYEWVEDWHGDYSAESVSDPKGPLSGSLRIIRGGIWSNPAEYCRSAFRNSYTPDNRAVAYIGFRLALSLE